MLSKVRLSILVLGCVVSCAPPTSKKQTAQFQEQLEILSDRYGVPGISVVSFDSTGVVQTITSGVRVDSSNAKIDSSSVFSAASLSKSVFAYLVLKQVSQGEFDLDKPLVNYFNYPDIEGQLYRDMVTARMVLTHTSGLPNWRKGELEFINPPGVQYKYSGEGYVWLQKVIEHIQGQPINAIAHKMVFEPLGMERTSYIWKTEFEGNYAIPHNKKRIPRQLEKYETPNMAYSLLTTPKDYAKFLIALTNGVGLSPSVHQELMTSQVKVLDNTIAWGLGIGLQYSSYGLEFWHWGDNGTSQSYFSVSPTSGSGFVMMTNSGNGLKLVPFLSASYTGSAQPGLNWAGYR